MGGAERVLYRLVQAPEFEHVVVYFHEGPFVQRIVDLGVRVVKIEGLICRYDPIFFFNLLNTIRKENPGVIHALLWAANITARMCAAFLRKPVITVYHNNVTQDSCIRAMLDRITMPLSNMHVAVSEQVAQSLRARTGVLRASSIEVISNGIVMPVQSSKLSKQDLGLEEDVFVIGSVGRFVALKRFDVLLEAAARCVALQPRVRVVLVGVGVEEAALRALAKLLDIEDKVLFIVGKDAGAYYSVFDCFVQCSDKEGISIALLEAMGCTLPCIVMGESFMHPVITHNHDGLVCIPGDREMLVSYIMLLMMYATDARALADKAAKKVKNTFNEQVMVDKYMRLFRCSLADNV
jgi:glycosyltransferase involved in cell wall biosynthesis